MRTRQSALLFAAALTVFRPTCALAKQRFCELTVNGVSQAVIADTAKEKDRDLSHGAERPDGTKAAGAVYNVEDSKLSSYIYLTFSPDHNSNAKAENKANPRLYSLRVESIDSEKSRMIINRDTKDAEGAIVRNEIFNIPVNFEKTPKVFMSTPDGSNIGLSCWVN